MTFKRQSVSLSATELHNYDLIDGIVVRIGEQYKPPPRINVDTQRLSTAAAAEELLAFEYDFHIEGQFIELYKARWQQKGEDVVTEQNDATPPFVEVDKNEEDEFEQLRRWQGQDDNGRVQTEELDAGRNWRLTESELTNPKSRYIAENQHAAVPQQPPSAIVPFFPFNMNTMTTLLIPNKNPSPPTFGYAGGSKSPRTDNAVNVGLNDAPYSDAVHSSNSPLQQQRRKPSLRLEDFEPGANPFDSVEIASLDDRKELLSSSSSSSVTAGHQPQPMSSNNNDDNSNSIRATSHQR